MGKHHAGQPEPPGGPYTFSWDPPSGGSGGDSVTFVIGSPPPPPTYTIGGSVSGLTAGSSVVLQNNGGEVAKVIKRPDGPMPANSHGV